MVFAYECDELWLNSSLGTILASQQ